MSQGTPKVAAPARQQTGDALFGKPVNEPIAESVRLAPRRLSHDELPSPTYTHFFQPKDESTKPVKIIELRQGIFCYIPDPFTKLLYSLYSAGYNSIYDTLMRCQKLAFADYKKSGFDMNAVIERQPTHIQELLNKTVVPTNFNIHINNLLAQVATLNKNENSDLLLVFIMRIILLYESQTATMRTLIEKRFACATIQPGTNRSKKMSPIDIQDELFISDFEYFRSDKKTIYRSNNQPSAAELSNASAVFPTETNRLPSKDLSSLRLFEAKTKPEANESVEGKIKRSKRIHASQTLKNAQKHQVFAYVTARSMLELDAHACLKEYVRAHKEGTKKVEEVLQPETTQRLEIR